MSFRRCSDDFPILSNSSDSFPIELSCLRRFWLTPLRKSDMRSDAFEKASLNPTVKKRVQAQVQLKAFLCHLNISLSL